MLARATTHALVGLEARPVEVEAHLQRGVPAFSIVGLPDKACQEAKERVRSGITSAELEWPLRRLTVNLAPAGLRKEGSGFDLPIALAVLAASRQIPAERLAQHAALGELALDGRVRPVPGALVAAEAARRAGLDRLIFLPSPRRRPLSPGSSRFRSSTSPRRALTCAAPSSRAPSFRRNGATKREVPTSPTCGARSAPVARSSWRRRAGTTFSSQAHPGRGRPCLPAGSRASSRS